MKQAKDFSDAYVVRGMALFVNSDFSSFAREDKPVTAANAATQVNQAVNTMKEALKQNPDCKEGMHYLKKCVRPIVNAVLDGKEKFRSREFDGALEDYSRGLTVMSDLLKETVEKANANYRLRSGVHPDATKPPGEPEPPVVQRAGAASSDGCDSEPLERTEAVTRPPPPPPTKAEIEALAIARAYALGLQKSNIRAQLLSERGTTYMRLSKNELCL